ncbi:hypothetical protein [Pseudomonas weihenstephanensis]|uniref:Uncharacterized protein n=1 Tax=Pseudomonas weihenstephanensis TaxID=1608994 RepID=A0ABS1ZMD6_9PSED|nr:hypothetical protein [Pseudomonas weihenstephanensis]MBM1197656.1 hypothetical protein [Pseudomonas weihenstephanensis]
MQNQITLRDIENLKKLAKQARALHPGLSHAQRLNLMAQDHLRARNYHEVRKWVARSLEQHYEPKDSGVVYCKLCRFTFGPAIAQDSTTHEKRHLNFEDALFSLGTLPTAHATREQKKREAHSLIHSAPSAAEELVGVEQLVSAWYDRSLESAIDNGDWKKHPSIAEYAAMIFPTVQMWLQQSRELYLSKYGCKRGVIPEGQTTWVQPEG